MPNYNYRSNDYMRRNQYARQSMQIPEKSVEPDCVACPKMQAHDCCMHDLLKGLPVAMAYVPWQEWQNIYPAEKALCRGTIFEELDKPFLGIGGCVR